MVPKDALQHRNRMLASNRSPGVHFLQGQHIGVGLANEFDHAIQVVPAVRSHPAMDVPCHDPDG